MSAGLIANLNNWVNILVGRLTEDRAERLDRVDADVSTRASAAELAAARGELAVVLDRAAVLLSDVAAIEGRLTAARAAKIDDIRGDTSVLVARLTEARAGLIDALSARLTEARAGRLDAAVSSRASASDMSVLLGRLPLSRVEKLDAILADTEALDDRVSEARMAILDGLSGGMQVLASPVQTILLSTVTNMDGPEPDFFFEDIPVAEVDPTKTIMLVQGSFYIDFFTYFRRPPRARLINGTTLRVSAARGTVGYQHRGNASRESWYRTAFPSGWQASSQTPDSLLGVPPSGASVGDESQPSVLIATGGQTAEQVDWYVDAHDVQVQLVEFA